MAIAQRYVTEAMKAYVEKVSHLKLCESDEPVEDIAQTLNALIREAKALQSHRK